MPWKKMRLRDATVLARVDASGEPLVQGGRVEVRYSAKSPKAYRAARANLVEMPGAEILPDEHCVAAEPDAVGATGDARKGARGIAAAEGAKPEPAPSGSVVVYADGACSGNPGPAGVGLVVIDGPVRIERSEYLGQATNNIAELTAIQRALEATDATKPVVIYTDSTYAIGVLSQGWKARANQELVAHLRSLLQARPLVRFVHVRGHSGVALNERADELARQAIAERRTVERIYRSDTRSAGPSA